MENNYINFETTVGILHFDGLYGKHKIALEEHFKGDFKNVKPIRFVKYLLKETCFKVGQQGNKIQLSNDDFNNLSKNDIESFASLYIEYAKEEEMIDNTNLGEPNIDFIHKDFTEEYESLKNVMSKFRIPRIFASPINKLDSRQSLLKRTIKLYESGSKNQLKAPNQAEIDFEVIQLKSIKNTNQTLKEIKIADAQSSESNKKLSKISIGLIICSIAISVLLFCLGRISKDSSIKEQKKQIDLIISSIDRSNTYLINALKEIQKSNFKQNKQLTQQIQNIKDSNTKIIKSLEE